MKVTFSLHLVSLIVAGLIAVCILCPAPVTASMTVVGSKYMGDISPGTTDTHIMTISSKPGDAPMDLSIAVMGFGETPGQNYISLPPADDTSPYSARNFITLDAQSFHLNPGESKTVKATIAIPKNVGDGGRYAMIQLKTGATGSGSTGYVTAISVPVMITIAKSAITQKGTITDVNVGDIVAGQPFHIVTALQNSGNHDYYSTKNTVTITDSAGNVIGTAGTEPSSSTIIPTYTVNFDVPFDKPLSLGTYTIKSQVSLGDGTVLDTKTIPFEMKTKYIAPPSQENITVTPQKSAVLASSDGRISVNFPSGAVLSDVAVTLKPLSLNQLPALPEGAKAGGTSFRIEGLSGLLSKDATISVKYSDADLSAAGGDASKLVLARYDTPDNKWSLLPTNVNKDTTTLSATTNRFGSWAVMASTGGVPAAAGSQKTGGFLPLNITTVIVSLGVMVVIIGVRVKKN